MAFYTLGVCHVTRLAGICAKMSSTGVAKYTLEPKIHPDLGPYILLSCLRNSSLSSLLQRTFNFLRFVLRWKISFFSGTVELCIIRSEPIELSNQIRRVQMK